MFTKELDEILNFLDEKTQGKKLSLRFDSYHFYDILNRKQNEFKIFKDGLLAKWEEFKLKNQSRVVKKTYTSFFYENFDQYYTFYIQSFFGFSNSIKIQNKEKISDNEFLIEYDYFITPEEDKYQQQLSQKLKNKLYGLAFPMGYLFLVTAGFGVITRRLLKEDFYILVEGAVIKNDGENNYLNFLVLVRESKNEIFKYYLDMSLYYFLKRFKDTPNGFYEKLLEGREKLYKLAMEEYPKAKERLVDLMYYFYKKCQLLQSFSPLLDFINFVGSRVEDSIFSKIDIIKKSFLDNFDYTEEKKNSLIKIFQFLDNQSSLFCTFQANNLPSVKSQFNLFLLYMKYYFGSGLESLEVGNLLNLPEIFRTRVNRYNARESQVISANSIKNIENFMRYFSRISNSENIDWFFEKIFTKSLSQLNHSLFRAFLMSLNTKLFTIINDENTKLAESHLNITFTFDAIADHICRMLYVLINKIFIRSTPDEASKNFIDPRGRYIGKNIALRVLELFIFQCINVSDDIWPDYLISLNKDRIQKDLNNYIDLPDNKFYSAEELTNFMMAYNFESYKDLIFFEEWLLYEIIVPLNNFINKVKNLVKNPSNNIEVYERLIEILVKDSEEKSIVNEIKSVCQYIAPFWKMVE